MSNPDTSVTSSFAFLLHIWNEEITRAQSIATIEPYVILASPFIWFMHLSIL